MIPGDPILTTDPFDAVCVELGQQVKTLVPTLKNAVQGWPDPKWFEDTGANFPSVFFVLVSEKGTNTTSRNLVYASTTNPDGTMNVYYERQKLQYLLQVSIFTTDPQARLDIGWAIKQYLINTMQLPINTVGTARFVYTGHDHMPEGRDNFYQRDIGFEVTVRVLDGDVANVNKTIQQNNTIS